MIERIAMVLGGWLRSWKVWIALLVLAIDLGIQAFAPAGDLFLPVAQYAATAMLAANASGLLHGHLLLPGRSLVPGTRRFHGVLTLGVVGGLLLPTVATSIARAAVPFAQLTVPVGLLVGFAIASVRTPSLRGVLIGACGGSLGPLAAWLDDAGPNSVAVGLFAAPWQMAVGGAVAIVLTAVLLSIALRREEVPSAFRGATGRRDASCDADGENTWLASALPLLRKRPLPRQARASLPTWREASAIWRRSSDPLHPFAMGLLMGAFYALLTLNDLMKEGALSVATSATLHLFVVLGCAPLATGYSGRRVRIEALRPVARDDTFRAFARAFTIDLVQYAAGVLTLSFVLHAVVDAPSLAQSAYWIRFLPVPGMLAVGAATTCIALRWTRYGGFAGFILSVLFYAVIVGGSGRDAPLFASVAMTIAGFATAAVFVPIAREAWKDFEPGRR